MNCPQCGEQNVDNALFCKDCGAPLSRGSSQSRRSDFGGGYSGYNRNNNNDDKNKTLIIAIIAAAAVVLIAIAVIVTILATSGNKSSDSASNDEVIETEAPTDAPTEAPTEVPAATSETVGANEIPYSAITAETPVPLPAGSSATTVVGTMWVYNVANSIYLRTNPSENAGIITTIPVNTQVGYIDTVGSWHKISYNGTMGYSKSQYLTSVPPSSRYSASSGSSSSSNSGSSSGRSGVITGVPYSAYLRRNATLDSSASNIICEIPSNASITVYNYTNGFYRVKYNGYTGYVKSDYVSFR